MTMVKDLTIEELQNVIKTTVEETMQEFMEEVFASNSQNYLASIEEARQIIKKVFRPVWIQMLEGRQGNWV